MTNQDIFQLRLASYPEGLPKSEHFERAHDALPEVQDGQIAFETTWISIDPAMKGWVTQKRSYMPPVAIGEAMRAFGVAKVTESKHPKIQVGDWITGMLGVQSAGVLDARLVRKIDTSFAPPEKYLGGLGMTGYTAYFGLFDVAKPEPGQTVVVSAAAGAVGSVASQLAKMHGCKVIGIAGGLEKCNYLKQTLKLHGTIDYKNQNVAEQLDKLAPQGIDVYFDNVGGQILDDVLMRINPHARIAVCGAVSQYENLDNMIGPKNYMQIITQSAIMQGFTMKDYIRRIPEAFTKLYNLEHKGELILRDHIIEGIDNFTEGLRMIYAGENQGKLLLKL